ncbi:MAG: NAD(P)/FAD-dependent oxidoreductase [Pseudomonadota bacterium]|nr:NAD(P)/FAD-dependent oxidoreductase [Pseudomonadota bacterium]
MNAEVRQGVADWLARFGAATASGDPEAVAACFAKDGYWRDLAAFTWNIATFEGQAAIREMLGACLARTAPSGWSLLGTPEVSGDTVQAWATFETATGRGKAHLRLKDGRCTTLLTALMELKGHEEKAGFTRENGVEHGAQPRRVTWLQKRRHIAETLGITEQPFCLVIGAGQGGLALAARLKRLGVPTLVIEKLERPGDAWRTRYDSLCLHDPVWYDHMPYLPFPDHWPVYTPKDKMADWLECYARLMELDIWTSTTCLGATPEPGGGWTVEVDRAGTRHVLKPAHLILATGMSGMPKLPDFPGMDSFSGTQMHSSAWRSGRDWQGRDCVVVGSNNSAHDIAADLWEHGARVTMLQRSPTLVIRADTIARIGRTLYSEKSVQAGIDVDTADLLTASVPYAMIADFVRPSVERMRAEDADFYRDLAETGFMLSFGEDESGIGPMYLRRGSGYYIDVGASQLVIDGEIALRTGVNVARMEPDAVVLDSGERLPAELVVHATGYGPMDEWAELLISPEVAARVGRVWGLGSGTHMDPGPWEGELRNMWKPTRQPGLWFQGGNLAQARHYSRYLALQLKARFEGIPTPVHAGPEG